MLKFFYRLIIDKKERKLKKGSGFHLDIVLVCLSNVGCGLIGAPFMCAATVRSVAHVSALTVMSSNHAPGDKPFIVDVKGITQFNSTCSISWFPTTSVEEEQYKMHISNYLNGCPHHSQQLANYHLYESRFLFLFIK